MDVRELRAFHGLPYEDIDAFLASMELSRLLYRWSETEMLACANLKLLEPASEWFDQERKADRPVATLGHAVNGWASWDQFKDTLYQRFDRVLKEAITGGIELKQGGNEPLHAWLQRVQRAAATKGWDSPAFSHIGADALMTRAFLDGLDPTLLPLFPPGMQWGQIVAQVELAAASPDMTAIMGTTTFSCSNRNLVGFLARAIAQDIPLRPTSNDDDPTDSDIGPIIDRLERLQARFSGISVGDDHHHQTISPRSVRSASTSVPIHGSIGRSNRRNTLASSAATIGSLFDSGSASGVHCVRCNRMGHDQTSCPNRPRKCYKCRRSGHVAVECPENSDNEEDTVTLAIDHENLRESVLHSLCEYVKTCPRPQWCHPPATKPWDTIGMGIVGPFKESKSGNRFVIFALDAYLDTPEIRAIPSTQKDSVMEFFIEQVLARHGCPRRATSSTRAEFRTSFWDYITKRLSVERVDHTASSLGGEGASTNDSSDSEVSDSGEMQSPTNGGQGGRSSQLPIRKTIKGMILRLVTTFDDKWDQWLEEVAVAYRTTEYKEVKVYIPDNDKEDTQEISEGDFVWLGMDGPFTVISIEDGKFRLMDMFGKDMDGLYSRSELKLYGTQ